MSVPIRGIAIEAPRDEPGLSPFASGAEHLLLEFERLRLMLAREVLRLRASHVFNEHEFRGLYISDEQVDAILQARCSTGDSELRPGVSPGTQQLATQIQDLERVIAGRVRASLSANVTLPLVELSRRFHLSPLERDAVLICVAPEVDLHFETLYSYAQNDVTRKLPTADLMLRLCFATLAERVEHRTLVSAESRLFQDGLLRFSEDSQNRDASCLARPIRTDRRIVDFLLGGRTLDARIEPFTGAVDSMRPLASLYLSPALATNLQSAARLLASSPAVVILQGPRGSGKRSVAEGLSYGAGRTLLVCDVRRALVDPTSFATALSLVRRECVLRGADVFFARADSLLGDEAQLRQLHQQFEDSLDLFPFSVFLGTSSAWPQRDGSAVRDARLIFELPVPVAPDRARLWSQSIQAVGASPAPDADLVLLANRFALTGGEIQDACRLAKMRASLGRDDATQLSEQELNAAARCSSSHGLRKLAQKVESVHSWGDLVLPPRYFQQLREICAAERYRQQVYSNWGFDRRLPQGRGLNVLFSGASGTGKTMSAGIIARELARDLYKIDLSTVVSKYIGETEKHLNLIFREATSSNAILFFDEADALFGKRSEVKDAHDRYANVEISYLLQKMEEYQGIVILATNFRKNIDDAFTRRIQYIVEFPFPTAEYREKIWRGLIPSRAPLGDDVDFGFLARQFEFAGGNIRNVVLAAAFLAAEQNCSVRMEHFIRATSRECQKLGKLASRTEFREFYDLTRDVV